VFHRTFKLLGRICSTHGSSTTAPRRVYVPEGNGKEMNLTDVQAVKVKAIFEEQKKEMQKLFESAQDDPSVMHEKMKKIDGRIAALLNDKQKEKFAEMKKQHGKRFD
jgi:hypothetical protein